MTFLLLSSLKNLVTWSKIHGSWTEIFSGVTQGSILGPLLFNIFLCELFLFIKNQDVASYADDTTPNKTGGNSAFVIQEVLGNTLLKWLNDNSMKASPAKYYLLLSGSDSNKIAIGNKAISSSKCKKLLRVNAKNF